MRSRPIVLLVATAAAASIAGGCTPRPGVAYIEIENDQSAGGAGKAEPVLVDPRVDVAVNEYRRSHLNEGSNIKQRIVIRGPVMIVPAPTAPAPTTQPAR